MQAVNTGFGVGGRAPGTVTVAKGEVVVQRGARVTGAGFIGLWLPAMVADVDDLPRDIKFLFGVLGEGEHEARPEEKTVTLRVAEEVIAAQGFQTITAHAFPAFVFITPGEIIVIITG
ncbi:hypothetical protein Ppb6_00845 [Photorhabdus australis subsp. thailandensis]|uniref:Uncharacterized protein n=1 Tax=Photorhabdus australis subsp. thailandensis TaxID=2805096 RepID=A0A1C0U7U0_9GAMM|nr:hypothetical protein Ppb6_00845 [Photorhabdus australis subsp. thailandensis]